MSGEGLDVFFSQLQKLREELAEARRESTNPITIEQRFDRIEGEIDKLFVCVSNWMVSVENKMDEQDAYSRRNNLLFHGIPENPHEDTSKIVLDLLKDKTIGAQDLSRSQVCRSHRLGPTRQSRLKPRPIIIKFTTYEARASIFRDKKKLKSSGITITEQLTGKRMKLMNAAKNTFGQRNVWSLDGSVMVLHGGRKHKLNTYSALQQLTAQLGAAVPILQLPPGAGDAAARPRGHPLDTYVNTRSRNKTPSTTPTA